MTLQTEKLTYQEYLDGPETKARYDIVDGEMVMAPSPKRAHQTIVRRLASHVDRFVAEHELGEMWFAPLDVVVQEDPLRVRQPDLMFVSNENSEILGDFIHGGPDLVAEILSPSNSRSDIEEKLSDYARIGVRECWLVSPEARTAEVLRLDDGKWSRLFIRGAGEDLESAVLPGLALPISEIFRSL
jgi:Uma2 family endonuclease